MIFQSKQGARPPQGILLHACCGPCSLEPVRVLRENGCEPTVFYSNSNIHPPDEHSMRFDTLKDWADGEGLEVVQDDYMPERWEETVGSLGDAIVERYGVVVDPDLREQDGRALEMRAARCRACYRLRFEECARHALEHGYRTISTTLSVSPYQYTDIIAEELRRAADSHGVEAFFVDWRPYYPRATARSKEAGMYRQNYCGCRFSIDEAQEERAIRKEIRESAKRAKRMELEIREAAQADARSRKREERKAYDEERRRRKAILKAMRDS